ncbi:MAG: class I SAM-dependent methyltransferase [Firmicutes bacterium]|nr:class I SAM-dependent methyltransferase [Bacillota bacterium]
MGEILLAHRFNPAHLDRLVSPERAKMLPPETVIGYFAADKSAVFADIGAGPGFFTLPAAQSTTGQVFGVDIEPAMLEALRHRAQEAGQDNIHTVVGDAQAVPLEDGQADCTLCSCVLHEVPDLSAALHELYRITKPGGRVVLVEWDKKETGFGPPVADRLDRAELASAAKAVGFVATQVHEPGEAHYALVCERP